MHTVRADYPADWPHANLYILADLHIGDPNSVDGEIKAQIDRIENDPYGLAVCNGDLLNTALRNSVSDVYGETLSPMRQIETLVELLRPIAGKIIAVTTGNHEARTYRSDGIDVMRMVCRELGVEAKYNPDGVLCFLRFGVISGHGRHRTGKSTRQWYSVYMTHGSGGGRKEGAKAIRLADMASIVDCDLFIHSHTHVPMVMKQRFYRVDACNCSAKSIERTFVNSAAALDYGGYGQAQEYKPSSRTSPVIHFESKSKRITVTL